MRSISLEAMIRVKQNDAVFYISAEHASVVLQLRVGLQSAPDANMGDDTGLDTEQDLRRFVKSVESSAFAQEVQQMARETYAPVNPFQRLVDKARVEAIASYLETEDAVFANSVILATRPEAEVQVIPTGRTATITMHWEGLAPTNIIDGQHRLEALRVLIERRQQHRFREFMVPFTLLLDVPYYMQAELFAVINGQQKPVNRSRIYDLLGYRTLGEAIVQEKAVQGTLAVFRYCHHIVKVLNSSEASPWRYKIKMRGTGSGVVTQAAFIDALALLVTPKKDSDRLRTLPLFYPMFRENDLVTVAKSCVLYFRGIAAAWSDLWSSDESLKGSLFGKTNGVIVMFRLLHDIALLSKGITRINPDDVRQKWRRAPESLLQTPPATGGRSVQQQLYDTLAAAMFSDKERAAMQTQFADERRALRLLGGLL